MTRLPDTILLAAGQIAESNVAADLLCHEIELAARCDAPVLLTGERGVGKGFVAEQIHRQSQRCGGPLVTIRCGSAPASGYPGLLRAAHSGTMILKDVGDLSLQIQALFLQFLETGEVQTDGRTDVVNARVITVAERDLLAQVQMGEFRADLFYRLNVVRIDIPYPSSLP